MGLASCRISNTDGEYGEKSVREKTCLRETGRNEIEKIKKRGNWQVLRSTEQYHSY
jgi:hypothetical protein